MKKLSLIVLFAFQSIAFAGPVESVSQTVTEMLSILRGTNEHTKISRLCRLVKSDVDNSTIGTLLLGTYANLSTDSRGIRDFKKLVPSIIMDQFYGLLHDEGDADYEIQGTVPRGSSRVGVKAKINGRVYVIVVQRSNNRVVDVEWNNLSLINTKRGEFQRRLRGFNNAQPVSALVDSLNNAGVNKCL